MYQMSKVSAAKKSGSKVGTQHTAVEVDDDNDSAATIELGADGKPTYEFFLKEYGFNGMNLAGEVVGEVVADDARVTSVSSKQSYDDALRVISMRSICLTVYQRSPRNVSGV